MDILKQSTAVSIVMGPMLNDADGNTPETTLNIAQADIRVSKNGGVYAQSNNATGATHMEFGKFSVPLDNVDTATLGKVRVDIHKSGALAVWREFTVVPADVYDSLVLGTDVLHADVTQWLGTAAATPSVAGVPEVDLTHCGGSAVAAGAIPNAAADAAGGLPISDAGGLDLDTKLANTHEITVARMGALTDWLNGERLDLLIDQILADTNELQTDDIPGKLLAYVQLLARSDAAIATDNATELTAINADGGSGGGDFSNQTDAIEAIRDRGDTSWVTGVGGSDRLLMVDTTIATLASQTSFTLISGSVDDDAYNNCTIVIEDAATATQKAIGIISGYAGATKTVTLEYDPAIFTMTTTDKVYILAENALKATLANRQLNVAADGDIAGNVDGSVASVTGHTAQTGDSYARLGTPAAASIAADLVVIDNFVDDLESRLSAARAGYLDNLSVGAVALASALVTAQDDLDIITGADGAIVATASKSEYALSSAGVDAVQDDVIEGALTSRHIQRILLAALAGKTSGGGTTTLVFQDEADTKPRITATVDVDRNRTAMTLDGT
jgi:hypothetical protein